jgi:hypothetical protein
MALEGAVIPIHAGDATVGRVVGLGVTLHGGIMLSRVIGAGLLVTYAPGDGDPRTADPELTYYGLVLEAQTPRSDGRGAALFVEGGIGRMHVDDVSDSSLCRPPACFAEGGPDLSPGSHTTGIAGLGLDVALSPAAFIRTGLRFFVPRFPSQAGLVLSLGFGVAW